MCGCAKAGSTPDEEVGHALGHRGRARRLFWDLGAFAANGGSVSQLLLRLAVVTVMFNLLGLTIMAVSYGLLADRGRGSVVSPRPDPGGPGLLATPIQFVHCRRTSTRLKQAA